MLKMSVALAAALALHLTKRGVGVTVRILEQISYYIASFLPRAPVRLKNILSGSFALDTLEDGVRLSRGRMFLPAKLTSQFILLSRKG